MGTNVRASYVLAREAARLMVPRGYGRIVNIGSALAVVGARECDRLRLQQARTGRA
jgi:NAD(P)-dependent dehydrogenase (short-subunit alcohol dehydrogenase family)